MQFVVVNLLVRRFDPEGLLQRLSSDAVRRNPYSIICILLFAFSANCIAFPFVCIY